MFKKVLIANRGAIATRIIKTLKKLSIKAVAVYSEADRDSLHVQEADESYSLGAGSAASTYLNQDLLFEIIKKSGAEAVHPGYGFLSENPDFSARCAKEGVVFLGPTEEQMISFGLKHKAREIANAAGVPLPPGTGLLEDANEAVAKANAIGYPVMLKSTAGGGGIGMKRCYSAKELANEFDTVKRLAVNNFKSGGIFLEKFIEQARHIEVQIFGDGEGNVLAIGERDCSAQRRNQKVVEECPAPGLTAKQREALRSTAVSLGKQVKYRGAGTVEYVFDVASGQFYFLEVNTRLQVEHGVTEMVYGIDLVEWMIRLGAKELAPLAELGAGLRANGHAIEARLYAEDPVKDFRPSAGIVSTVEFPKQDRVNTRIDTWIESGTEVSAFFDPMLAKLIAWGSTREESINGLTKLLESSVVYGIETNQEYLLKLLQSSLLKDASVLTSSLNNFSYSSNTLDVLAGGTLTTLQDYPGRTGLWSIGVPPSGPMDSLSFRIANRLLGNASDCAAMEITVAGPTLRFNAATKFAITGAGLKATLDDGLIPMYTVLEAKAGQVLKLGKIVGAGARSYLAIAGGFACPLYLGSRSTFTLGLFGGHAGRAIRTGDVLHFFADKPCTAAVGTVSELKSELTTEWEIRVIYGPHGAPDFFTEKDIATLFSTAYEVHYNSSVSVLANSV